MIQFTEAENLQILDRCGERQSPAQIAKALKRSELEVEAQIRRLRRHGIAACSSRRGGR